MATPNLDQAWLHATVERYERPLCQYAYVDFVDASFRNRDIAKALKQKALEERIEKRFSIPPLPR